MPSPTADAVCYLDTNALWKYYRDELGDLNVRRLVARVPRQVLISPLTILEFIGKLMKYCRKGQIKRSQVRAIAKRLRRDAALGNSHRPFRIVPIPQGAFREAQGILLEHGSRWDFGANDALHLGIVLRLVGETPPVFVTCDGGLTLTAQRKLLSCYDPEKEELL
jgi:predicted nucleic acid-binding protein